MSGCVTSGDQDPKGSPGPVFLVEHGKSNRPRKPGMNRLIFNPVESPSGDDIEMMEDGSVSIGPGPIESPDSPR